MSHSFYCKSCGLEVEGNAETCPRCGKIFSAVRCPECGYTGQPVEFHDGCPSCSHGRKKGNKSFFTQRWMRTLMFPLLILLVLLLILLYRQL